jgi:hypothetical protein
MQQIIHWKTPFPTTAKKLTSRENWKASKIFSPPPTPERKTEFSNDEKTFFSQTALNSCFLNE